MRWRAGGRAGTDAGVDAVWEGGGGGERLAAAHRALPTQLALKFRASTTSSPLSHTQPNLSCPLCALCPLCSRGVPADRVGPPARRPPHAGAGAAAPEGHHHHLPGAPLPLLLLLPPAAAAAPAAASAPRCCCCCPCPSRLPLPLPLGTCSAWQVPYSEHSSFTELRDFVDWFQPQR